MSMLAPSGLGHRHRTVNAVHHMLHRSPTIAVELTGHLSMHT